MHIVSNQTHTHLARFRNGPNEFSITGSLRNWTIINDIPKIQVPTLVTNGAKDEAQDIVVLPYVNKLPHGKWVKFFVSLHTNSSSFCKL